MLCQCLVLLFYNFWVNIQKKNVEFVKNNNLQRRMDKSPKILSARKTLSLLRRSFEAEDGIPRASSMTIRARDSSAGQSPQGISRRQSASRQQSGLASSREFLSGHHWKSNLAAGSDAAETAGASGGQQPYKAPLWRAAVLSGMRERIQPHDPLLERQQARRVRLPRVSQKRKKPLQFAPDPWGGFGQNCLELRRRIAEAIRSRAEKGHTITKAVGVEEASPRHPLFGFAERNFEIGAGDWRDCDGKTELRQVFICSWNQRWNMSWCHLYEPLRARTLFFGKFLKTYKVWLY